MSCEKSHLDKYAKLIECISDPRKCNYLACSLGLTASSFVNRDIGA